jgi:hypothetical protein
MKTYLKIIGIIILFLLSSLFVVRYLLLTNSRQSTDLYFFIKEYVFNINSDSLEYKCFKESIYLKHSQRNYLVMDFSKDQELNIDMISEFYKKRDRLGVFSFVDTPEKLTIIYRPYGIFGTESDEKLEELKAIGFKEININEYCELYLSNQNENFMEINNILKNNWKLDTKNTF